MEVIACSKPALISVLSELSGIESVSNSITNTPSASFIWTKWDRKLHLLQGQTARHLVLSELSGIERQMWGVRQTQVNIVLSELSGIERQMWGVRQTQVNIVLSELSGIESKVCYERSLPVADVLSELSGIESLNEQKLQLLQQLTFYLN